MLIPEKVKELFKVISIAFKWRFVVSTPNRRSFLSLSQKNIITVARKIGRAAAVAPSRRRTILLYTSLPEKKGEPLSHTKVIVLI